MRHQIASALTIGSFLVLAVLANGQVAAKGDEQYEDTVPYREGGAWMLPETDGMVAGMPLEGPYSVHAGRYSEEGTGSPWGDEASAACLYHGCDPTLLLAIIDCESGGDPDAYHANPYGGADVGLVQINDLTWGDIAYASGTEQIWWAAGMLAAGEQGHWWPSQDCWGWAA